MPGLFEDIVSKLAAGVQAINNLTQTLSTAFPRVTGTFTLSNATTTVVTQPATKANSIAQLTPTNATAALTQRTAGLYVSAYTAGTSFSISTQSGTAQGNETFSYVLVNPS